MVDHPAQPDPPRHDLAHPRSEELSLTGLAADLAGGATTSLEVVTGYLDRIEAIDRGAIGLGSIIAVNPDALDEARTLDRERADGRIRGPLHGVPILVKDNIDTGPGLGADRMATTAGSLALADPASQPAVDATVVTRLREAGAIILAKTNLSEWANFRSTTSTSGWSAVGGLCRNPYVLDRTPCGSSSGSGAAVAASLAAAALGTETNGSIVCPSAINGLVGIKPTVGLTSRAGVVPISYSQDTVGPMARTVADAAALLGPMTGVDPRDPATGASGGHRHTDYTRFVDPDGLRGARIGVARQLIGRNPRVTVLLDQVVARWPALGVEVVDPVEFPSHDELFETRPDRAAMLAEFKTGIATYLAGRLGDRPGGPRTLADLIRFNLDHVDEELRWFGQELWELAEESEGTAAADHPAVRAEAHRLARDEGIDAVLAGRGTGAGPAGGGPLDAIIAPTTTPAWPIDLVNGDPGGGMTATFAAVAGYPLVTVPLGQVAGLPVGLTFMGSAWSEPTLIRLASGFEAAFPARRPPRFLPTMPPEGLAGR